MSKREKPSIKRPSEGKITVSAVTKEMEEKGLITGSARNLERRFAKLIDKFGGDGSQWKDENDHYSIEVENKAIIEAYIIELNQKGGYTDKLLTDKRENIEPEDVFRFYNNFVEYINGKVSDDVRDFYMASLDEDIGFTFWGKFQNIIEIMKATAFNIKDLPYVHQVMILEELETLVQKKWSENIEKELEWIFTEKLALQELERELNEERFDS